MAKLPLIVGVGGMNAAGRSSGFHSYKRLIHEVLPEDLMKNTWSDLAHRMGIKDELSDATLQMIKDGTLVRKINDPDGLHAAFHHKATVRSAAQLHMKKAKVSSELAEKLQMDAPDQHELDVVLHDDFDVLIPDKIKLQVTSAGALPQGFDPAALYNAHHDPRGLALTIYGASDALNSLGCEWDDILNRIRPDEISVYAGSALSQIDEHSLAGLVGQPLSGQRINSKMMAMSLAEMPADFINSYVINNVGSTGHNVGACATFLYNLRQGMLDIQHGYAKVAIVGSSEAPIQAEVIEGFRVMGALATDESLCELDQSETPNHRRACRPFSSNSGFTLAEAAQFVILMEDDLALELGLSIYGAVAGVFVNADANKKSIASPGIGNYVTVAKAAALAKAMLGEKGLQENTYVQAHGTGTPQNRTTESHILNEVAKTFGIKQWPVTAVKSYVGHTVSAAGGDQLLTALGSWQYGWLPGIKTIDHIASDVYQSNLNILMDHLFVGKDTMQAAIINSKGFGGNNASAVILSPEKTMAMLTKKHGEQTMMAYKQRHEDVKAHLNSRDEAICQGDERIIYQFGEAMMDQHSIQLTQETMTLSKFKMTIQLPTEHPYNDYY